MGAAGFTEIATGPNAKDAFSQIRDEARYEYGHGGYSGTIAEKGSFELVTNQPVPEEVAEVMAQELMATRFGDKWGPAGAIPIVRGTRKVAVTGLTYRPATEELVDVVMAQGQLPKDEKVEAAYPVAYSMARDGTRQDVTAEVTITRTRPMVRAERITVTIPASGADGAQRDTHDLAASEAKKQVRLRKGESIVSTPRSIGLQPVTGKATAVAPKGKTLTRYVVIGLRGHDTWATGFDTQAQARAWALEALEAVSQPYRDVDVIAITRRADGQPLVRITKPVRKVTVEVEVLIRTAAPLLAKPDAWLFFGYASS